MIYYDGNQWRVTDDGIEERDGDYYILAEDLRMMVGEGGWIDHLTCRGGLDIEDFIRAYQVALRVHSKSGAS